MVRPAIAPVRDAGNLRRVGLIRSGCVGLAVLLATTALASAQTSVERGGYLVNTIMTCQNCHTPMGPNGPQFDRALSGGLRFDEPPFDVTASNITPDRDTGIGGWKDSDIKAALQDHVRPNGVHLAEVMPSGFYKILTPGDLDGIAAELGAQHVDATVELDAARHVLKVHEAQLAHHALGADEAAGHGHLLAR